MSTKDECISKMWCVHTLGYYLAIKRHEFQIHATVRLDLENIMLSERSQTQKAPYHRIPFTWNIQKRPVYTGANRLVGA